MLLGCLKWVEIPVIMAEVCGPCGGKKEFSWAYTVGQFHVGAFPIVRHPNHVTHAPMATILIHHHYLITDLVCLHHHPLSNAHQAGQPTTSRMRANT